MALGVKTQVVKGPLWVVWVVVASNNFINGTRFALAECSHRRGTVEGGRLSGPRMTVGLCEKRSEGIRSRKQGPVVTPPCPSGVLCSPPWFLDVGGPGVLMSAFCWVISRREATFHT